MESAKLEIVLQDQKLSPQQLQQPVGQPQAPPSSTDPMAILRAKLEEDARRIDAMKKTAEPAPSVESQPAPQPTAEPVLEAQIIPILEPAKLSDIGQKFFDAMQEAMENEVQELIKGQSQDEARRKELHQLREDIYRARRRFEEEEAQRETARQKELQEARQKAFVEIAQGQIPTVQAVDPTVRKVQKDMDAERMRKEEEEKYRQTRMEMDPEFARKEEKKDRQKQGSGTQDALNLVAMLAGKGNIPLVGQTATLANAMTGAGASAGAGAAAGLAAAAGPIGAAIAVAEELKKQSLEAIQTSGRFAAKIAAIDADGLAGEFNNLIKKVPVVGEVVGAFGDALGGVIAATDATASRLAQYSGPLAAQEAMNEVRNIMRDIQRAQTMGDDLVRYLEQRQTSREKLEDVMTRIGMKLIPIVTSILEKLESALDLLDKWKEANQSTQVGMNAIFSGMPEFMQNIARQLGLMQEIASNTKPPSDALPDWLDKLQMSGTLPPAPMPNLPQLTPPGLPGAALP